MFNLDVSGSMLGNKWNSVCSSVNAFISKLGDSDLVSGVVFNDQSKILNKMSENDPLFTRPRSYSGSKYTIYQNPSYGVNNVKYNQ